MTTDTQTDDFEAAVDAVGGSVETIREVKKYPMTPKGSHKARCVKAETKETEYDGRKSTVLSLEWELATTYDDNGEQRHYKMWSQLGLSYGGTRAKLPKVFRELTGEEITPLVKQEKFKRDGKEYIRETFQYEAFVEMECELFVNHEPGKADPTKMFAKIGGYSCSPEMQKKNAALVFDDGVKA